MPKMKAAKNFEEYVESYPKNIQTLLKKMRSAIRKAAPKATEKISYGMPGYSQNGVLAYFNAYKTHLGFYPGPSAIVEFGKQLEKYKCSKGTVQFPLDKNLPLPLVTKMVKFRVKENLEKTKKKAGKPQIFSKT